MQTTNQHTINPLPHSDPHTIYLYIHYTNGEIKKRNPTTYSPPKPNHPKCISIRFRKETKTLCSLVCALKRTAKYKEDNSPDIHRNSPGTRFLSLWFCSRQIFQIVPSEQWAREREWTMFTSYLWKCATPARRSGRSMHMSEYISGFFSHFNRLFLVRNQMIREETQ